MNTTDLRSRGGTVRNALCLALCMVLYAALPQVQAQTQTAAATETLRQYAIPAGPLSTVLSAWGVQSDRQLVFVPDLIVGKHSRGVSGRYGAEGALAKLLDGTGLTFERVNGQTYSLKRDRGGLLKRAAVKKQDKNASPEPERDEPTQLKAVTVSASRIDSVNIVTVTPTISFTPESLRLPTYTNVGDALYDLPYFSAARGPSSTGTNVNVGASPIDLRSLGVGRTLLLVDGHRISGNTQLGGNDLNSVPSILVKQLDVVTGGASASWGSGAVSGVVNIALDHDIKGVKIESSYGQSNHSDGKTRTLRAAAGTDFSDGKGHVQIGGDFVKAGGILRSDRPQTGRWQLMPIAGTQNLSFTPNVGLANQSVGGLILSGVLRGKAFGPDGTLHDHTLERVVGTAGVGDNAPSSDDHSYVIVPRKHYTVLGSARYDFTDNLRITNTIRYFQSNSDYETFSVGLNNVPISINNAFLPSDIRQTLVNAGETGFTLGRFRADINYPRYVTTNKAYQETVNLDGTFDNYWRWTTFFSHGVSDLNRASTGRFITANLNKAIDSVIDPVTHDPVCSFSLTHPASDCVPINLFGEGSPSQQAQKYVTGASTVHRVLTSDEGGISLRGEPWSLPAGSIGVAVGLEGRHISLRQDVGPLDTQKALYPSVSTPEKGAFSVIEGFGEVNIPLLTERPGFEDLAANLAARASDYSTTGNIWTWKAGITNEFVHGLRARIAYSRDIRAPNLDELYQQQGWGANPVYDPVLNQSYLVDILLGGNPNVQPEKANTLTLGASWKPSGGSLDGFQLSADYYSIDIKDVITTVGTQGTVDRCLAGNKSLCTRIVRGPDNRIDHISSQSVNLSAFKEDGVDLEVGYSGSGSLFGSAGQYHARTIGTWVHKLTVDDGQTEVNYVGVVGSAWIGQAIPRWRAVASLEFTSPKFDISTRVRYLSAGFQQLTPNIVNNRIGQYFYFDVGGSFVLAKDSLNVYGEIRNLMNRKPPISSGFSPFYDVVGRFATIGLRLNF